MEWLGHPVGRGSSSLVMSSSRGGGSRSVPCSLKTVVSSPRASSAQGRPGRRQCPSKARVHFVREHTWGWKQHGAGWVRETKRQGEEKGGVWSQVTCGGHGTLLNASHVAWQELVAEVRNGHVQKHLPWRFEAV